MDKQEFDSALGAAQDRFQAYQEGLQRGVEIGRAEAGAGCLLHILLLVLCLVVIL